MTKTNRRQLEKMVSQGRADSIQSAVRLLEIDKRDTLLAELRSTLEYAREAVVYYDEHEGASEMLKDVDNAIARIDQLL